MDSKAKKLVLSQETLRNLLRNAPRMEPNHAGTHTCDNGACPSHHPPHCMGLAAGAKQH